MDGVCRSSMKQIVALNRFVVVQNWTIGNCFPCDPAGQKFGSKLSSEQIIWKLRDFENYEIRWHVINISSKKVEALCRESRLDWCSHYRLSFLSSLPSLIFNFHQLTRVGSIRVTQKVSMSAFARTFLRSSRFIARGNRTNPVQYALGHKGSIKYTLQCRNYAAAFTRDKPHVNIGEISLPVSITLR